MSSEYIFLILIFCAKLFLGNTARILVVVPTASISHQVVFRPFTQELAKIGHEVVVITTDPAFSKQNAPENLIEIDVHDAAYTALGHGFSRMATGDKDDIYTQMRSYSMIIQETFEAEIVTKEVQALINDKNQIFDLLILEACSRTALVFSHIFKAPVIIFSTLPSYDAINAFTGSMTHPLLFPTFIHQKINNLTSWEKMQEIHRHYSFENLLEGEFIELGDEMLKKHFGSDIPSLRDLRKNVDMVFLAQHHIWDNNRPVPPNVVYVGGIYPANTEVKELPEDLTNILDASKHGIIYMSFGTNVNVSLLPHRTLDVFLRVFSQIPYDVLLKWNSHEMPAASKNVKLVKWVPQASLLHHPKIKLFITQGGLQSTEDAINAGVPLIGMPMLADQWYNVEQYVRLKIGLRLDVESITEEKMLAAINTVIGDSSYRRNIASLREVLADQPQSALERAVWWAGHVIRNKGGKHLRAPTALITTWDFYEIDLILSLFCGSIALAMLIAAITYILFVTCKNLLKAIEM